MGLLLFKKTKHMDQNSGQRCKRTQKIVAKWRVRRISFCFKSLPIAAINITLSFSAKKWVTLELWKVPCEPTVSIVYINKPSAVILLLSVESPAQHGFCPQTHVTVCVSPTLHLIVFHNCFVPLILKIRDLYNKKRPE